MFSYVLSQYRDCQMFGQKKAFGQQICGRQNLILTLILVSVS